MAKEKIKKESKKAPKVEKKQKKDQKKVKKESYVKSLKKELKMVKWPEKKEVLKYTISTIAFCILICAFFQLLLLLMSVVKGWF